MRFVVGTEIQGGEWRPPKASVSELRTPGTVQSPWADPSSPTPRTRGAVAIALVAVGASALLASGIVVFQHRRAGLESSLEPTYPADAGAPAARNLGSIVVLADSEDISPAVPQPSASSAPVRDAPPKPTTTAAASAAPVASARDHGTVAAGREDSTSKPVAASSPPKPLSEPAPLHRVFGTEN
jgi:hypothetical protein